MNEQITLKLLVRLGDDQDAMVRWCMDVGLISKRYICPKCKEDMNLMPRVEIQDKIQWRCRRNGHDISRSIRKGSWFENSRLSMYKVLMMTHMWCMKIENDWIMAELHCASSTVCSWKNFCREVCAQCLIKDNEMLGGEGTIVEIGEFKFGKKKYESGRFVEGKWVFGGVERGTNKCFMVVVAERNRNVLLHIIKEYVCPGTTVISDCWQAYDCFQDETFQDMTANHSINFKDPDTGAHTNSVEGTWSAVKRQLNCHISKRELDSHLFEYMWRRRYSNNKNKLMNSFLSGIISVYPPHTQD